MNTLRRLSREQLESLSHAELVNVALLFEVAFMDLRQAHATMHCSPLSEFSIIQ